MLTPGYVFNAADWTATVNKVAIHWTQLEVTFEQFHIPAKFAIEAPLQSVVIPSTLQDKPTEVVIQYQGKDFFIGQLDDSHAIGNFERAEDLLHLTGRDLSAKFVQNKLLGDFPANQTSSEVVKKYMRDAGFTDFSKVTATSTQRGDYLKHNYHRVAQGLTRHDVIFDLAALENFVFRVYKRQVFFGPQPDPNTVRAVPLAYKQDFLEYDWNKSHLNTDVQVKVTGFNKHKQRVASTQGSGSLLVHIPVLHEITANDARSMAVKELESYERGIVTLEISEMPGDPALNDILFRFNVRGIAQGIDQMFFPSRLHHVITQDSHVVDLSLYNNVRITA